MVQLCNDKARLLSMPSFSYYFVRETSCSPRMKPSTLTLSVFVVAVAPG